MCAFKETFVRVSELLNRKFATWIIYILAARDGRKKRKVRLNSALDLNALIRLGKEGGL